LFLNMVADVGGMLRVVAPGVGQKWAMAQEGVRKWSGGRPGDFHASEHADGPFQFQDTVLRWGALPIVGGQGPMRRWLCCWNGNGSRREDNDRRTTGNHQQYRLRAWHNGGPDARRVANFNWETFIATGRPDNDHPARPGAE